MNSKKPDPKDDLKESGKALAQATSEPVRNTLGYIREGLHRVSHAIDSVVYKANPHFSGINTPVGNLNLEFFKAAVVGYGVGVLGTRRLLVRPLICAGICGLLWQTSGLKICSYSRCTNCLRSYC
eukprot:TRINITY_DN10646_c0_g4_i3.p4 TRINITY_DN10646_c0_g4~~TRINITY_DN10646_c0_g4_i3.p4  ORF type:complete len:125 (-),score=22.32 TRINITY_DN10646_c0_g4_i3:109-483(-)